MFKWFSYGFPMVFPWFSISRHPHTLRQAAPPPQVASGLQLGLAFRRKATLRLATPCVVDHDHGWSSWVQKIIPTYEPMMGFWDDHQNPNHSNHPKSWGSEDQPMIGNDWEMIGNNHHGWDDWRLEWLGSSSQSSMVGNLGWEFGMIEIGKEEWWGIWDDWNFSQSSFFFDDWESHKKIWNYMKKVHPNHQKRIGNPEKWWIHLKFMSIDWWLSTVWML